MDSWDHLYMKDSEYTEVWVTCDQAYFSLDVVRKGTPDTIS